MIPSPSIDFTHYKPLLGQYLRARGILPPGHTGNFRCPNPAHDDGDTPSTASAHLYNDSTDDARVKCFGCDFVGDIYDVCGLIDGIGDITEQYRAVAAHFGDPSDLQAPRPPRAPIAAPARFQPDPIALTTVSTYLRDIRPAYLANLAEFAQYRGIAPDAAAQWAAPLFWWPGIVAALKDPRITLEVLTLAGIIDPAKEKSAWQPAGAVVEVGVGFKLHYAARDKDKVTGELYNVTRKRETVGGHTFPRNRAGLPAGPRLVLCEGEIDEVSGRYAGIDDLRAMGGTTALDADDAALIAESFQDVVLCFDNDDAGRIAAGIQPPKQARYKSVPALLREAGYKGRISAALWTGGGKKDIDDMVKHGHAAELIDAINNAVEIFPLELPKPAPTASPMLPTPPPDIDAPPFQFLGFDKDALYFLPKRQNIAFRISRGDKSIKDKLNEIAPEDWWFVNFNKEVADPINGGTKTIIDYPRAIAWLREKSVSRGMYNDDLLLGVGAHIDAGHAIVNTGRAIVTPSGSVSTYEEYTGENTYCRSRLELKIQGTPWTRDDSINFLRQLQTFTFENELAYYAIAGYCAIAPFSSFLFRRPHIWITAKKGQGKSYLLHDLMYPALGEGFTFYRDSVTTEAAIRQALQKDTRPVILDEFEITGKYDKNTIDSVMSLSRTAYAGEFISKGTANQTGISFATKMMFCFASINVNISNAADKSRIIVCRMGESRGKMVKPKNPDGLRARMFLHLDTLRADIQACTDMMTDQAGHDSRTADTYSPFFAGFWRMLSDAPFGDCTLPDDSRMLEKMRRSMEHINANDESLSDEETIFSTIFQKRVRIGPDDEKTVAEMLTEKEAMGRLLYEDSMQRFGMRRTSSIRIVDNIPVLAISANNKELRDMLVDTPFFSRYNEVLKRHPSYIMSTPVRIGGAQQQALLFRWSDLEAQYFREERDVVPF